MITATENTAIPVDSPESRSYNRVKRWLGIADSAVGIGLLVLLLATGWSGTLRDWAMRGASANYSFAVFLYLFMLIVISKVLGGPLEYYGFRLEHRYHLSNQRFRSWVWDEIKGLLVGLVLATIVVELLYLLIRHVQHWWLVAWAVFLGLVVLLAQLAPVVLFPIFYKFEPMENEELRNAAGRTERACRHPRARSVQVEAIGEKQEGECSADRAGSDASHHPRRHSARPLHRRRD